MARKRVMLPPGGGTFGGSDAHGLGTPVALDTSGFPYGAGVDDPNFIPGSPHNLPPSKDRPAYRQFVPAGGGLPVTPSSGVPEALPMAPERATVYDPFHFARPTEGTFPVGVASAVALLETATKRNYLMLRNSSTGAQVIFIAFGGNASLDSALRLDVNEIAFLDPVPQQDMYAIADAAGAQLSYSVSTIAA